MNDTKILKQLLTPYDVGHKKIHIGPEYDGGYVISEDILKNTDSVYSLGIGTECDFDFQLANMGYSIHMYESSHPKPPKNHENFFYKQLFMNANNLKNEIELNNHNDSKLLMAMDIEGGEYNLLLEIEDSILSKFKQITFEIHDVLHNKKIYNLLEKLNRDFCLIHIHTNNNCIRGGAYSSGMIDGVPNVLELTYVHRSEITQIPKIWDQKSPINGLDFKNQLDLPDVELNWWIQ